MGNLKWMNCHRKPERSFFYKGQQFPLCARCTGIYTGFLVLVPFILFHLPTLSLLITALLVIPLVIDGYAQANSKYESKNWWRFTTGLFCGIGLMNLMMIAGDLSAAFVLTLI